MMHLLVRLFGGRYEWETQTTDPSGCWRTWSTGFSSLEDAMSQLEQDRACGKRWTRFMTEDKVKWRVEQRVVWFRWFYPCTANSKSTTSTD